MDEKRKIEGPTGPEWRGTTPERDGVWGGLTATQRRRMRTRALLSAPVVAS